LIVGRNNAGKSAFLEAVLLYVSNASLDVIYDLIKFRQENWDSDSQNKPYRLSLNPIRHLFKGHRIPDLNESGFKLAVSCNDLTLSVRTAAFILEESDDILIRRKLNHKELKDFDPDALSDPFDPNTIKIFVISEQGENTQLLFENRDFLNPIGFRQSSVRSKYNAIQFVSTQGLTDTKAAQLWDSINLTDLEKDVINGLKLVEKNIIGLAFVEGDRPRERVPVVKLEKQEERIPLKSLGDGVTRVFHIILSLVNAKGGVLLIDEFENGLHWAVQQSVWEIVFQLAETLDVQVFCTTHSRDCIDGFGSIWKKYPQYGAFFRLFERNKTVLAQEYDIETLSDSLETDVEIR
jgi:AAA15 family ATPase/GTPase